MNKGIGKFVGEKIRYYRKKNKLTQKEFGKMVGVRDNTISSYEHGTNDPSQTMLYKMAEVFDIKVDDFFPERKDNDLIHESVKNTNEELDAKDIMLIKKIREKALELEGEERERLMNNIRFAIDFFEKRD